MKAHRMNWGLGVILAAVGVAGLAPVADAQPYTAEVVKDIQPGSSGSSPAYITAIGSTLYFRANDGTNGSELWKSDGTGGGTQMVKDINPSGSSNPNDLTEVGGALFFVANDGTNGFELWGSTGTGPGTGMVKDIWPGSDGSSPDELLDLVWD